MRLSALLLVLAVAIGDPGAVAGGDPFADRPASAADLVQRLALAHAERDLVDMLNLFDWRGLDARARRHIEAMVARDLANRLVEVDVVEAPPDGMPDAPGTSPNRAITHLVVAVYDAADGRRYVSLHQVGESEGIALIALPVAETY
ncbi:MAG: hypothetical protein WD673_17345 [Alphaproteobacteria bacterium]